MPGIEFYARKDRETARLAAEARLRGANFESVREGLASMFQMMKDDGDERGGKYFVDLDVLEKLRPFLDNPTMETAVALVTALPSIWELFDSSKKPFGDPQASDEVKLDNVILNAVQIPVIEAGVACIKLGIFNALVKAYDQGQRAPAVQLAFCVTGELFDDPVAPVFKRFSRDHRELIEQGVSSAFAHPKLCPSIMLAYAALIISLGWETGDPFNPSATSLTNGASEHGVEIPNIVRMWGNKAIVRFFAAAQEFMSTSFAV